MMRTILHRLALALAVLCAFTSLAGARAKADQEHEVKAAFIANFIKFINWPDLGSPGSKFVVGIYGADAFEDTINVALEGRSVYGHPVVVQQLHSDVDIKKCRMVISGASSEDRISQLERICAGSETVLVGESEDFARSGGTIGLVVTPSSQVRFNINLGSARRTGVTISSKLLSLAQEVYRGDGQ